MAPGDRQQDAQVAGKLRRERPWLYLYNRRLRHLQGISIRNLTLSPPSTRLRRASVDDEFLPYALKSPAKILVQQEQKQIHHSRSTENLRPIQESEDSISAGVKETAIVDDNTPVKSRPMAGRMRRRSTLDWVNASPQARQKTLEDIIGARMADVFVSLHVSGLEEPVYVSEVIEKAMNPDFRFFDLAECGPSVTRLDELTVKVWAKSEKMDDYQYLIEMDVKLRSLRFIGKSLGSFLRPLPQNCILFHMKDGIYASSMDFPMDNPPSAISDAPQRALSSTQVLPTSSFDALMRLSTLDDCIQDALQTRAKLEHQISQLLEENKDPIHIVRSVAFQQGRMNDVHDAIDIEKKRLAAAQRKRDDLQTRIDERKEYMRQGREDMARKEQEVTSGLVAVNQSKEQLHQIGEDIHGQRRRICEDLLRIFPIEPIPNQSLTFTIRDLPLPNSEFDDVDENAICAALGYVAQIVNMLQYYLSVPLPYPIQPRGSTSLVEDPISMTTGGRVYPLFMKGTIRYRFEYAVFLLNKNIEILSNHLGLRVMDLRQTLPNLKYLLYVATAGKGEIPARKAGGIRGFLRGGAGDSDLSSRRQSTDSNASSVADGKQPVAAAAQPKKILADAMNGPLKTPEEGNGRMKIGYGGGPHQHAAFQASKLRDVS